MNIPKLGNVLISIALIYVHTKIIQYPHENAQGHITAFWYIYMIVLMRYQNKDEEEGAKKQYSCNFSWKKLVVPNLMGCTSVFKSVG
jgi:hypothetical protein